MGDGVGEKDARHCRVASWNIHSCVGMDGRHDVRRITDALVSLDADIFGLQEVDWRIESDGIADPLQFMADALGMHAVEGITLRDHRGHYGNALLTRYEVEHVDRIPMAFANREPRGALIARLNDGARTIQAGVSHFGLVRRERREQMATLHDILMSDDTADARLLMIDSNEWSGHQPIRRSFMTGLYDSLFTGRTFPSRFPMLKLDCVLVGATMERAQGTVVSENLPRRASDHLPVVVDITW